MFFRSVFSIFFSAFFCDFAYFFCAFSCFSAFRASEVELASCSAQKHAPGTAGDDGRFHRRSVAQWACAFATLRRFGCDRSASCFGGPRGQDAHRGDVG